MHSTQTTIGVLLTVLAVSALGIPRSCAAVPPVSVHFAVEQNPLVQGEPIVVRYELNNLTEDQTYQVDLGSPANSWVSFRLTDEHGRTVAARPDYAPHLPGNVHMIAQLKPGGSYTGRIVAGRHFEMVPPGQYVLTASVCLQCYRDDSSEQSTRQSLVGTEITAVVVGPADPGRLSKMAGNLAMLVTSPRVRGEDQEVALDSLFSIPATIAAPAWRTVLADSSGAAFIHAIDELKRLGTPTAVAILAEYWGNKASPSRSIAARDALEHLYKHGDPALRLRIGGYFTAREGKLPAAPSGRMQKVLIQPGP